MDAETTIAQGLHITDDSAGYDAACKRVLSEKVILARIMKSCLEEYKDCDVNEIAEKYIEGQPQVSAVPVLPDEEGTIISGMDTEDKSVREGTVTYDIRFRAIAPDSGELIGLIINMEAQSDFYPGYPLTKRGVYYCCRMISSQYGREFTGSHYEKIKKVYSIWICMNPPKSRENTITRYRLVEEHLVGEATEPVRNYDLLSIIMLCLGGPEGENYGGVLRMLDVLLSNETSEAEKRKILQDDYNIQMTQTMEREVSVMCNLSKGVMEKGLAKGRAEGLAKGRAEGLAEGRAEGLAEGHAKGRAKGRAEGLAEGRAEGILSSIKGLMETMNLSIEQAMAALKLPEAERQKYMDLLEKQ